MAENSETKVTKQVAYPKGKKIKRTIKEESSSGKKGSKKC